MNNKLPGLPSYSDTSHALAQIYRLLLQTGRARKAQLAAQTNPSTSSEESNIACSGSAESLAHPTADGANSERTKSADNIFDEQEIEND